MLMRMSWNYMKRLSLLCNRPTSKRAASQICCRVWFSSESRQQWHCYVTAIACVRVRGWTYACRLGRRLLVAIGSGRCWSGFSQQLKGPIFWAMHGVWLRRSTNKVTKENIFINKNMTKMEAILAYEDRCRRRHHRHQWNGAVGSTSIQTTTPSSVAVTSAGRHP